MNIESTRKLSLQINKRPSLFYNTLQVFIRRRKGLKQNQRLPTIQIEWPRLKINETHFEKFKQIVGLTHDESSVSLLYPLTLAFPLNMSILSHKSFPLSMFRILNIRNHIIQHQPINLADTLHLNCTLKEQRVVPKGLELDIFVTIKREKKVVWECVNTYYFRGRFGSSQYQNARFEMTELVDSNRLEEFSIPDKSGFPFAKISGDTNGLHYMGFYSRLLGYKGGFAQPILALANSLNRIAPLQYKKSCRLDVLIKGPVYYNRNLSLIGNVRKDFQRFDLFCEGNSRPCICAELTDFELQYENIHKETIEEFNAQNLFHK